MSSLKEISTKELSEELETRLGVESIVLEPYEVAKLKTGQTTKEIEGPAIILINID